MEVACPGRHTIDSGVAVGDGGSFDRDEGKAVAKEAASMACHGACVRSTMGLRVGHEVLRAHGCSSWVCECSEGLNLLRTTRPTCADGLANTSSPGLVSASSPGFVRHKRHLRRGNVNCQSPIRGELTVR